jgi:hypothetical protein
MSEPENEGSKANEVSGELIVCYVEGVSEKSRELCLTKRRALML